MHVSLIVPAPFDTVSGGYEYDRRIVGGLVSLGHTVDVVELPGKHPRPDDIARDAACAALDKLPLGTRCLIDGMALPAFAGLEDALAAQGVVGLIHHPTAFETGLDPADRPAIQGTERRLFGRLRRLIVTSEATAETLSQAFGVDPAKIVTVPPGFDDMPRSVGNPGDGCEILSVGTLIPRKGHDVLLRALARLFDLDWRLTIVGSPEPDPAHAQVLHALAEELGIHRRVALVDARTPAETEPLWQCADLFALATHYEGFGMAIAEALRRGLPVAVTAGAPAAAMVGPECGVVCQPNDHEQLSKALRRLVFNRELRREMGEMAWQAGQALPSWPAQAQHFAAALTP